MEYSLFCAKIIGIFCFGMGCGMLLNGTYYQKLFSDVQKDALALLLGGIIALVIGLIMVFTHNLWVAEWTVIITIFGWMSLIKGLSILLMPTIVLSITRFAGKIKGTMMIAGIFMFALGAVFIYFGFFA